MHAPFHIVLLGALAFSSCTFTRAEINDSQIPERRSFRLAQVPRETPKWPSE